MALVDLSTDNKFRAWLEDQPREVSIAIAARAAWRVLPLLGRIKGTGENNRDILLPLLRASASALVAAEYPTSAEGKRAAAAAAYVARPAAAAARAAAYAAARAAAYAAARAAYVARPAAAAARAADVAADAAYAAARAAYVARAAAARAARWDAAAIANRGMSPQHLLDQPLWPEGTPDFAEKWLNEFRTFIHEAGDGFDIWLEWYEAVLKGGPRPHDAAFARAINDRDLWKKSPAKINAQIREWLEEERAKPVKPKPTPEPIAAPPGGPLQSDDLLRTASPEPFINAEGKLDVRRNAEFDTLSPEKGLEDLPDRLIDLIEDMLQGFAGNAPKNLMASLMGYQHHIREKRLKPDIVTLQIRIAAMRAEWPAKRPTESEWRGPGDFVNFRGFLRQHRAYIGAAKNAWRRDEILSANNADTTVLDKQPLRQAFRDYAETAQELAREGEVAAPFAEAAKEQSEMAQSLSTKSDSDFVADPNDRIAPPVEPKKRFILNMRAFLKRTADAIPVVGNVVTIAKDGSEAWTKFLELINLLLKLFGGK